MKGFTPRGHTREGNNSNITELKLEKYSNLNFKSENRKKIFSPPSANVHKKKDLIESIMTGKSNVTVDPLQQESINRKLDK